MSYRMIQVSDKFLFFVSDTNAIELNTYDNVKEFIGYSETNLSSLINDIKSGLIEAANEELVKMETGSDQNLLKTMAYVKLLQVVNQYFYSERLHQEELDRQALELESLNTNDWIWTGPEES